LTIIGVTDEKLSVVENFVSKTRIDYLIAVGGGKGYKTSGIPRAWLVSPMGEIVWEGHPGGLKNAIIEEHLKQVRLVPEFNLSRQLRSAEGYLNRAKYGSGIKALERYLRSPKDDDIAKEAKETLREVERYGREQLGAARDYAKEGDYSEAMLVVAKLARSFRGHELGDKAKTQHNEWKDEKKVRAELRASKLLAEARSLIKERKHKQAAALLQRVLNKSTYEGTYSREQAEKEWKRIEKYL
jgi:hypothetical protein